MHFGGSKTILPSLILFLEQSILIIEVYMCLGLNFETIKRKEYYMGKRLFNILFYKTELRPNEILFSCNF